MSKYVKDLLTEDVKSRLEGVTDALVVNVQGVDANANNRLRKELRTKGIRLLVIKNSLARRAAMETSLAPMFDGLNGPAAIAYGAEDIVSLAKEITKVAKDKAYEPFEAKGGVMEGAKLSAAEVEAVSKWPSRTEQLSILSGQILGVGSKLSSQLISVGGALASQIEQKSKEEGGE